MAIAMSVGVMSVTAMLVMSMAIMAVTAMLVMCMTVMSVTVVAVAVAVMIPTDCVTVAVGGCAAEDEEPRDVDHQPDDAHNHHQIDFFRQGITHLVGGGG